jgi:hypothetical protein
VSERKEKERSNMNEMDKYRDIDQFTCQAIKPTNYDHNSRYFEITGSQRIGMDRAGFVANNVWRLVIY